VVLEGEGETGREDAVLRYETTGKVKAAAARAILEEARSLDRAWWNGGIGFEQDEPDGPVELSGKTALFRAGVPMEDDLFMSFADMQAIVGRLADWAKRYRLKWHLTMHGDDWGAVDSTGPTPPLQEQLKKWSKRARVAPAGKSSWVISEERRAEIAARHGEAS
jgi:hypothetical protein